MEIISALALILGGVVSISSGGKILDGIVNGNNSNNK